MTNLSSLPVAGPKSADPQLDEPVAGAAPPASPPADENPDSVEFFKRHAARSKVPYQKMIRNLLDAYANHHRAGL